MGVIQSPHEDIWTYLEDLQSACIITKVHLSHPVSPKWAVIEKIYKNMRFSWTDNLGNSCHLCCYMHKFEFKPIYFTIISSVKRHWNRASNGFVPRIYRTRGNPEYLLPLLGYGETRNYRVPFLKKPPNILLLLLESKRNAIERSYKWDRKGIQKKR
jgi:hypothetical protein